ncbi:KPN_02809 family neutral zinc metallopeptidase [Flexivirga caeni]|uniref:Neutral zinc metallopeptidase n=1 Tax=Flexivirga caeni TaxID=2294115 RepID=A0A3M9MGM8_9MICO|nr:neutral zinc metallopeptidase [Flexivirga caeni]RNI24654.1 hypothetical protein EFY87_02810 [Flexivirga caeni]
MTFNDNANIGTSDVSSGGNGGGGGMMPGGVAVGGVGGVILVLLLVFFGGDLTGGSGDSAYPGQITQDQSNPYGQKQIGSGSDAIQQQLDQCRTGADANRNDLCLIKGTVASIEGFWRVFLPEQTGHSYTPAMTKVFAGRMQTGCGTASTQMGPFYCPLDKRVYLDSGFFQELQSDYGSDGGPLAKEYVLAHEYGHHVQDVLGLLGKAQQDPQGAESGSVRTELQADCFAGIWAGYADGSRNGQHGVTIEPLLKKITSSDIDSALSAAAAVGDDRIQAKAQGRVTPETWTHGSSAARQKWFTIGYEQGTLHACNTFGAADVE